jgi:WD40 repeat protein
MEISPVQSQRLPRLDAQNPWPGLDAYDEASQEFFHGREAIVEELLCMIRHSPITALYGKSGLGKSSLLKAGLFPKLRLEHFLPVYLHMDFSDQTDLFEQVAQRLEAAIADSGADCPPRLPGEDLWQYLHRKDMDIWSADYFLLTPILVFDQLEELFSSRGPNHDDIQSVLNSLADLFENRIPLILESDRERCKQIDIFSRRYSILLAFREDFLPEFLNLEKKVRSLLSNRVQLLPMSRDQAIAATQQAGVEILDEGVAERIVDFVADSEVSTSNSENNVEPVLLSLCCYQLNLKRRKAGADKIDATLVDRSGEGILEDFYRDAIKDMPENVPQFIETYLILGDRFRGNYPLEEALERQFIREDDLNTLIGRFRLLRVNQQGDTARIELIHDRLVSVVRKSRDKRLAEAREQKERQLRKEAELEARRESERREEAEKARALLSKKNKILWVSIGAVFAFALLAIILSVIAKRQTNIAIKATSQVTAALHEAEEQTKIAKDQRLKAIVLGLVAEAQAMLSEARIESEDRAFLQLLAAFGILPETESEAGLLDALLKQRDLVKLIMTGGPVMAVAFSPDGSRIISAGTDMTLRIWNAATGQPDGDPLQGHAKSVSTVAFSPDGSRIASGSEDMTLRLWDADTGHPIGQPLQGHEKSVLCLAFSPDGKHIVSGSEDMSLRLWDSVTGQPIGQPLLGHEKSVSCVAFSPDGKRIASGSDDSTLRLWDTNTLKPINQPLLRHQASVKSVAFSPDGSRIASGSEDMTLRLWDADTGHPIGQPLQGHWGNIQSVAFSPDGSRIVSGSGDKTLRLWDLASGKPIGRPLLAHKSAVTSVAFSPDGSRIASGSWDKTLRLRKSTFCEPLQGHTDWVNSVAFSPDGSRIVSGSGDNSLRMWDANNGKALGEALQGHTGRVESVAFSPDSSRIVSGSQDNSLRLWNGNTGQPIGDPLKGHLDSVTTVAFSPDGSRIVSGSDDRTLRLWDADTLQPIGKPLEGHKDFVKSVAFSPDGSRIVSGSGDKTLLLWDAASGESIGNSLLGHKGGVNSVAFSPDGTCIVSGSWDKTLRLWNAVTGETLGGPLEGHEDSVMSVAFSPDGRSIVSGSWDASLRLWDAATRKPIGQAQRCHDGRVQSVAFSPDGRNIVSGSGDKTLHIWPVFNNLPGELCKKLTRNMSRGEWREWVSPDIDYKILCPDLPIPSDDPSIPASTKCQ